MAILETLTYKQQKFCDEYLLTFNAYRAAITAGYMDNTARKGDLLHVPKIQAYLRDAMGRSAARAQLTHDMLLRELMKIAFSNMGNYYDDRGDPRRMHHLTEDEKAAICYFQRADVTLENGYRVGEMFKIKLHNKMAALDKLCRHTGFYSAKYEPPAAVDKSPAPEDIAFELKSAETQAESYTTEVSCELFEQMGVLPEDELAELKEEVEKQRKKEAKKLEAGRWKLEARENKQEAKGKMQEAGSLKQYDEPSVAKSVPVALDTAEVAEVHHTEAQPGLACAECAGKADKAHPVRKLKLVNSKLVSEHPGKETIENILTFSPQEADAGIEDNEERRLPYSPFRGLGG